MSSFYRNAALVCLTANSVLPCYTYQAFAETSLPPVVVKPRQAQNKAHKKKIQSVKESVSPASTSTTPTPTNADGVIQTTAGPVDGYRAITSTSGTKTDTPIKEIPQSIQVIPRSLIVDQKNLTVDEALKNISGVQSTPALQTPAYDSTKIRGFPAEILLDGFVSYYNAGDRDSLVNVERIEVLKGPSALLYSGGAGAPIGGAVNIVSKLPTDKASGEIGATFGSYNYIQPYFDINQPLTKDGSVLFRMTGEYSYANSNVDVIETKRYSFNPTWTFTNKTDTTLTVQARVSEWKQPEYQGLPAVGTVAGDFKINRDLFIGDPNIPDSYSCNQSITAMLEHKFNEIWSGSVKMRLSHSEFEEKSQTIVGADGFQANAPFVAPSIWATANVDLAQEQQELSINPTLTAKFRYGPTQNVVLLGADYSRLTDQAFLAYKFVPDFGLVDLTSPHFQPYATPPVANRSTDANNLYQTAGAYVQWQSTFYDRLHLLGGLRISNITIDTFNNLTGQQGQSADETKLLPRVGGVFDLTKQFSVFADYSEGHIANPFAVYNGTPKPEASDQVEAGAKFSFNDQLSGTVAAFEINRSNVPVYVGFTASPTGEQQTRGIETDLIWQPSSNWQFIGNYAFLDARFTKDDPGSGAVAGRRLNGVPEHSGRFWMNYKFEDERFRGLSMGAGVYVAGEQFVDFANKYRTDGYYTIDAKIAYDTEKYAAALTVKNLTGKEYFTPYSYFNGRVMSVDGSSIYGKVSFKY